MFEKRIDMIKVERPKDRSLVEKVVQEGQGHVFRFWEGLSDESRERLLAQLRNIDFEILNQLQNKMLGSTDKKKVRDVLEPVEVIPIPETAVQRSEAEKAKMIGEEFIRSGKVAAFLVAGGQGTRLGFDGPKGAFPVGPVTGKSLFQMHAEKILAAGQTYGVNIPWLIMTSETNDGATQQFFRETDFFGFKEEDIFFFTQRMIPALDEKGELILDGQDHIFMNPNGHGGSLLALDESGTLDVMKHRGVEILSYFQVDNALIKIIDPIFIGYHVQGGAEMSSKMVKKRDQWEKVGVFGKLDGKLKVIEYSDLSEEDMAAQNPDGSLKYGAGSIAIHLINSDFVKKEVRDGFKLPYHIAHKKIPYLDEKGELISPERPNSYKFETFIFDALSDTTHSVVMGIVREEEFSPLKNSSGSASAETVRRDLCNHFGRWLESAETEVPRDENGDVDELIEISPLYAMDRDMFVKKIPRGFRFHGALYLGPES